jgi:hypothetical protein
LMRSSTSFSKPGIMIIHYKTKLHLFPAQALEGVRQLSYESTVNTIVHSFFGFQGLK